MILQTKSLLEQITEKEVDITKNPFYQRDLLEQKERERKEHFLEHYINNIFKDKKYYSHFQEAVIQPNAQQTMQNLQDKKDNVLKATGQAAAQPAPPVDPTALAIERERLATEERIADKRIKAETKGSIGRTIASGLAGGLPMAVATALMGGLGRR